MSKEVKKSRFRCQYSVLNDVEIHKTESPVVSGQALTGSELFRRISNGLSIGCAVRSFNEIDPRIEKFSVYDSIGQFRLRHGMVDKSELEVLDSSPENPPEKKEEKSGDE